ncbi:MAG TPA: protein-glutamate O-methyltransferase [Phycisphaerae bacterium]|nr:protein-glutamate O-methyltransferase [Phycisphaerae bacterium]
MATAVCGLSELTDEQFERISDLVKSLCGINLHQGKKELVKARLSKRLRALGFAGFDEYIRYVQNDGGGDELVAMLDAISTNLTSFFREPGHFDYLAEQVLPGIAARAGPGRRSLRIWSAGCSTGEEPYTIAIVTAECLPDPDSWDVRILATDLSTRVLAQARQGLYGADRLKDVPGLLVSRYFTCVETRPRRLYRVNDHLRGRVTFARLNLLGPWPMRGPFDVIFCRNVMIYFDKPTQARLVERFWELLAPDGVLFVGHSESLAGVKHRFEYVQPTVYRKGTANPE